VDPGDPFPGYGEHAERIILPEIGLAGGGETAEIGEILAVVGMDTCRLESPAVVRHVVVGVPE